MTETTEDRYAPFSERVDDALAARAGEIASLELALHAANPDAGDADEILDDLLSELKGEVAAGAANQVSDGDANDVLALCEARFAEDVSNASVRRRIAALLVGSTPETLFKHFAGESALA